MEFLHGHSLNGSFPMITLFLNPKKNCGPICGPLSDLLIKLIWLLRFNIPEEACILLLTFVHICNHSYMLKIGVSFTPDHPL